MVVFPNCKINIGLNITSKRPDGFHNLQTIFYPLVFKDALEIIDAGKEEEDVTFSSSGRNIDIKPEDNLCIQAYHLLKNNFPQLPPVKMHLHKNIPVGAGLGGGSADGAFALQLLNTKFALGLSQASLLQYAAMLGSDCAFFIVNSPCFATGRGELLQQTQLDLSSYKILLINPGIHINTGQAFSQLKIKHMEPADLQAQIQQPIETWKNSINNDFETPVFLQHPKIKNIKDDLYSNGAVYASMSGSGSSVYGIFENEKDLAVNFPAHYFYKWV